MAIKAYDLAVNNLLLDQISEYYALYGEVKRELCEEANVPQVRQFIKNWEHDSNRILNNASKNYNASERTRLIQAYYAHSDENFAKAIDEVRRAPRKSIYSVIKEMCQTVEE